MMKQVCGYKDSLGKFWDTETETKISNCNIELGEIKDKMLSSQDNLETVLYNRLVSGYFLDIYLESFRVYPQYLKEYFDKLIELEMLKNPDIDIVDKPENPVYRWYEFWSILQDWKNRKKK